MGRDSYPCRLSTGSEWPKNTHFKGESENPLAAGCKCQWRFTQVAVFIRTVFVFVCVQILKLRGGLPQPYFPLKSSYLFMCRMIESGFFRNVCIAL